MRKKEIGPNPQTNAAVWLGGCKHQATRRRQHIALSATLHAARVHARCVLFGMPLAGWSARSACTFVMKAAQAKTQSSPWRRAARYTRPLAAHTT